MCAGYEHEFRMFASMLGAVDEAYEQPALVERSTAEELYAGSIVP